MKKRLSALLLVFAMLCMLPACSAAPKTQNIPDQKEDATVREYTDSCGRTVTLPETISKVAVSGPLAQIYAYPLCADLLVGFSSDFSSEAQKFISAEYLSLPTIGQLYGGRGTLDLEALLAAAPDVVIDVGESKGSMAEDLDALSEQCGIPFVHIEATVETAAEAYRCLGELTGRTEKAGQLASWCVSTLANIDAMMERIDADSARRDIIYCLGDKGLNCLARGSFHANTVNKMGNNVAVLGDVVSSGLGNEIDMEQLLIWDPDVIIFAPDSCYENVAADETWQQLSAVKSGNYYKTPIGPYGWLASPPAIQQYLGMLWLGAVLYPEYIDYDLKESVSEYYALFYNYDLSEEDYLEMISR